MSDKLYTEEELYKLPDSPDADKRVSLDELNDVISDVIIKCSKKMVNAMGTDEESLWRSRIEGIRILEGVMKHELSV